MACQPAAGRQNGGVRLTTFLSSPAGTVLRYALSLALPGCIAAGVDWRSLAGGVVQLLIPKPGRSGT